MIYLTALLMSLTQRNRRTWIYGETANTPNELTHCMNAIQFQCRSDQSAIVSFNTFDYKAQFEGYNSIWKVDNKNLEYDSSKDIAS